MIGLCMGPPIMIHAYHLVARANLFQTPLVHRNSCADLWKRLRNRFPNIAACILMPNHLHLLVFTRDPAHARLRLSVDLRAWTQKFYPHTQLWSPLPKAIAIPDLHHLKRQIRYVHLNPCRAGLVKDPLQWEWSTHRDVTGCVINPWPNNNALVKVFGVSANRLGEVMHRYVSQDPSVAVGGTPMARVPQTGEVTAAGQNIIFLGAAIASREATLLQRGKLRDLAVHTSHRLRLVSEPEKLNMSSKSWGRALARRVDEASIQVILKILADPRLRNNSPTCKPVV